jgi:hypothetical protein
LGQLRVLPEDGTEGLQQLAAEARRVDQAGDLAGLRVGQAAGMRMVRRSWSRRMSRAMLTPDG